MAMRNPNAIEEMFSNEPKLRQRKLTHSLATQSIELQMSSKLILSRFIRFASHSLHLLTYSLSASIYSSLQFSLALPSDARSSMSSFLVIDRLGGFTISNQLVRRYSANSSRLRFL